MGVYNGSINNVPEAAKLAISLGIPADEQVMIQRLDFSVNPNAHWAFTPDRKHLWWTVEWGALNSSLPTCGFHSLNAALNIFLPSLFELKLNIIGLKHKNIILSNNEKSCKESIFPRNPSLSFKYCDWNYLENI